MATNIAESVIKLITLDNQLISVVENQCFPRHLEFLNPLYAPSSLHYITLIPFLSYIVPVCALVSWVSYSRACKTGNRGDAESCEIDEQRVHVLLHDKVCVTPRTMLEISSTLLHVILLDYCFMCF